MGAIIAAGALCTTVYDARTRLATFGELTPSADYCSLNSSMYVLALSPGFARGWRASLLARRCGGASANCICALTENAEAVVLGYAHGLAGDEGS